LEVLGGGECGEESISLFNRLDRSAAFDAAEREAVDDQDVVRLGRVCCIPREHVALDYELPAGLNVTECLFVLMNCGLRVG
jgi:hypothetical protein